MDRFRFQINYDDINYIFDFNDDNCQNDKFLLFLFFLLLLLLLLFNIVFRPHPNVFLIGLWD